MFTDSYGQQSCTAGRASFILGQQPFRTGLLTIGMPGDPHGIPEWMPTIADVLKTQGYATGQFGKNHLGDQRRAPADACTASTSSSATSTTSMPRRSPRATTTRRTRSSRRSTARAACFTHRDGGRQDRGHRPAQHASACRRSTRSSWPAPRTSSTSSVKADKPFFVWFNTTRMHVLTHLKKESVGKTGKGIHADGMVEHDGHGRPAARSSSTTSASPTTPSSSTRTDNGAEIALWPDGAHDAVPRREGHDLGGRLPRPDDGALAGRDQAGHRSSTTSSRRSTGCRRCCAAAGEPDIKEKLQDGLPGRRQDVQGPPRRLQLPAVSSRARRRRARARRSSTSARAAT